MQASVHGSEIRPSTGLHFYKFLKNDFVRDHRVLTRNRGVSLLLLGLLRNCLYFPKLGFVQALAVDPSNTVFALVRNVTTANNLHDFAATHPHKNVHVFKADLDDISSIKVSLVTIGN